MASAGEKPGAPSVLRTGNSKRFWFRRAHGSAVALIFPLASVLVMFASAPSVRAQAGTVNPHGGRGPRLETAQPGFTGPGAFSTMPFDYSRLIKAEACESWTAAAVDSPTVSVTRLAIPRKARDEFQKACGKLKANNFAAAEDYARKAVSIYPDYAPAWVVLGQALTAENKRQQAIEACKQAMNVDPTYAPPYICLAQFAQRANDWDGVYTYSDRARTVDPANNPYVYFYAATADLHRKEYSKAEQEGLAAEQLDNENQITRLHLLLAEIYRARGDTVNEAAELRKFLQLSPHDGEWQTARTTLAAIQGGTAK
ncbi:MAG: tetratricopeptide repeat protein [Acidobacteriota bacterium]|nr:tetratricopeptide repeat protein [Acidobacteriota bacterium]